MGDRGLRRGAGDRVESSETLEYVNFQQIQRAVDLLLELVTMRGMCSPHFLGRCNLQTEKCSHEITLQTQC